jgi:hypothetical protein
MLLRTVGKYVPRNMVSSPRRYRRDDHSFTGLHVLLLVLYKMPHFAVLIATHKAIKVKLKCACEVFASTV